MKKKIAAGSELREAMLRGAGDLNKAVRATLGPEGRGVLTAGRVGAPELARKAADVQIRPRDVMENTGAILLRSAAEKTAERAGDGSVLAMLIAEALMREGNRLIAAGYGAVPLRRGLERCLPAAAEAVREQAVRAPDRRLLAALAAVSAGDESLGALIAEALDRLGTEGYVSVRPSDTHSCYLEGEQAFCMERGWSSRYMATDTVSMETHFDDAAVFVCAAPINSIYDILPLLDEVSRGGERLLVVADTIGDEVVKSFVSNLAQGTIRLCSVCVPGVGKAKQDWLSDAAALTGALLFGTPEHPDPKEARLCDCGRAGHVRVGRDSTRIENGLGGEALERHLTMLRAQLKMDNNELEDETLRRRIAALSGNAAVLRVGAATEMERRSLTKQAQGALRTVFDAARRGPVPGGGLAFVRAAAAVKRFAASLPEEERAAADALAAALEAPLRQIAENAGYAAGPVVAAVRAAEGAVGFDALSGRVTDLLEAGVVDSLGMCLAALETGVALAAQFLSVDAAVLIDGTPIEDLPVPDDLHLSRSDFM